MDNMNNDSLFVWQPALTAPKYYPVQAQYARVMVGKDMNISMGETFVGYGVGNGVSLIDFDAAFGGLEIPTGLDVLWLSFAEKKFYRFKQNFSKAIQEKTLKLFQKGKHDDDGRYNCFAVTLLPGGRIWLSLTGIVLNIEVSKDNNRFKISLVSGEKSYQLKDTKIHVFRQRQGEDDSKSQVVYNNHREIHSKYIRFIGE